MNNYINELFSKSIVLKTKLIDYGFLFNDKLLTYKKLISNTSLEIVVTYDNSFKVKVFDKEFNEEYLNYLIPSNNGEFVNRVRNEIKYLLNDINNKCCEIKYFVFEQSNRITNYIIDKYDIYPEYLFDGDNNTGVFRKNNNKKWIGIIMYINKTKLNVIDNKMVEVINLKVDDDVLNLLSVSGIYEAYHMSKKKWVSIILDDTLEDHFVENLIDNSFKLVK